MAEGDIRLASADAFRLLKYIVDLNRAGYQPTLHEVDVYAWNPDRKGTSVGSVLLGRAFANLLKSQLAQPAETLLEYIRRVGWVETPDDRVVVTDLGKAFLISQTMAGADGGGVLVLEAGGEFAYQEVMARLAAHGEATLVDPFLSLEGLYHVIQLTEVTKLLVGPKAPQKQLKAAVGSTSLPRPLELRASSEVHDRLFVPVTGTIEMLGTSLNGVSKRLSLLVPLSQDASDALRRNLGPIWKRATPLASVKVTKLKAAPEPGTKTP
jgi:hypothetical protein